MPSVLCVVHGYKISFSICRFNSSAELNFISLRKNFNGTVFTVLPYKSPEKSLIYVSLIT